MKKTNPLFSLTEGSDWKNLLSLSWPMMVSYGLQSLVGIVDLKMVGVFGPEAIAAVGASNQILIFTFILFAAGTMGASIYVSQYWGKGDREKASLIGMQTLWGVLLTGIFLAVAGRLAVGPLLHAMGLAGKTFETAKSYLGLLLFCAVLPFYNFAINELLRGTGDTKTPLLVLLAINLINVPMNYCFMFGIGPIPAMGATGAAIGTILSRLSGALIGTWILFSGRFHLVISQKTFSWPEWRWISKIYRLGIPSSLEDISWSLSTLLLFKVVLLTRDGVYGISAYAIGFQVETLSFLPGLAVMNAVAILVGQNIGAEKRDRAANAVRHSLHIGLLIMGTAGLVLASSSRFIVDFFTDNPRVIEIGTLYLLIHGFSQFPMAVKMIINGAYHGAGNTFTPFLIAIIEFWAIRIPLALLFILVFKWGTTWVWLSMAISNWSGALILYWLYRAGHWSRKPALSS